VLALLNGIDGVQSSSASLGDRPALIQVTLRPGADSAKVAEEVRRIMKNEVGDRSLMQVEGAVAASALQQEEWLEQGQIVSLAATEGRLGYLLASLIVSGLILALTLLYWLGGSNRPKQSQPTFSAVSLK
jgi:hypothetical protein